jgi:hypothetical protein
MQRDWRCHAHVSTINKRLSVCHSCFHCTLALSLCKLKTRRNVDCGHPCCSAGMHPAMVSCVACWHTLRNLCWCATANGDTVHYQWGAVSQPCQACYCCRAPQDSQLQTEASEGVLFHLPWGTFTDLPKDVSMHSTLTGVGAHQMMRPAATAGACILQTACEHLFDLDKITSAGTARR